MITSQLLKYLANILKRMPSALTSGGGVKVGVVDALPSGENHVGQVGGYAFTVSKEITRPADTNVYTANDVINTATSGSTMLNLASVARKNGGHGYITGIEIFSDQPSETWQPKANLYNKARASVLNDNAAFALTYAQMTNPSWARAITLPPLSAYGSISHAVLDGLAIPFSCDINDDDLYFDLQTLTGFTPASGAKYTVRLSGVQF